MCSRYNAHDIISEPEKGPRRPTVYNLNFFQEKKKALK
jgi:hypothetical protein